MHKKITVLLLVFCLSLSAFTTAAEDAPVPLRVESVVSFVSAYGDWYYIKYPRVPDFGSFTNAAFLGLDELLTTYSAGTSYTYGPEVTEQEEEGYAAELQRQGFIQQASQGNYRAYQKGGMTIVTGKRKLDNVFVVEVLDRIGGIDGILQPAARNGWYTAYPNVPDFKEFCDTGLYYAESVPGNHGGYNYVYENTVTQAEEHAYAAALRRNGGVLEGEYNGIKTFHYQESLLVKIGPDSKDKGKYIVRIIDFDMVDQPQILFSDSAYYKKFNTVPALGYLTKILPSYELKLADGGRQYIYTIAELPDTVEAFYTNALKKAGFQPMPKDTDVPTDYLRGDTTVYYKDNVAVQFGSRDRLYYITIVYLSL